MERPALDQATNLLTQGSEILLLCAEKPSFDAFSSMVGLALALETLGKATAIVSASHVPPALQFLPGTSQVRETIEQTTDLVVEVPLGNIRPAHVSWEQHSDKLRLIIAPERGKTFPQVEPTAQTGLYPWETIITLGSPDLHHLGQPFTDHAPFFYDTPILNIDRGTANEFFGTVNLVPATAGTVAEVVFDFIDTLGGVNIVTPEVATCLFTAILTGTHSFQAANITPRTFAVASAILEQDADRQTVTRNLFKVHTLPELRLVGRGLARLTELSPGVLWSTLLQQDFQESGATPNDTPAALQEMVERAGDQTPILLMFERTRGTLEVLVFPGRISTEDLENLRTNMNGTNVGQFILVALDQASPAGVEQALKDFVLPHLPRRAT